MTRQPPSLLLKLVGRLPLISALLRAIAERRRLPEARASDQAPLLPAPAAPTGQPTSPAKPSRTQARHKSPAGSAAPVVQSVQAAAAPACPHCRKTMVIKVAGSGANSGGDFWGCPAYPQCRGMRAIFAPLPSAPVRSKPASKRRH